MQRLVGTGFMSPGSMTGWVCDFQPQEAHPSSRRLASRIQQVMSAFQWIGSPRRVLSESCRCFFFLFDPHIPSVRLFQRLCGGGIPRQPRRHRWDSWVTLPHTFRQKCRMTSRVVTMGPRSSLGLQNPALIFFRSAHEICAGRVPSAPVSMLVSRLANALPCRMGWAQ